MLTSVDDDYVLKEIIGQYEVLVYTHCTVNSAAQLSVEQSERLREINRLQETRQLEPNLDVATTAVIRMCKDERNVMAIMERLAKICEELSPLNEPPAKKKKKREVSETETFDETVDSYILRTMRYGFKGYLETNEKRNVKISNAVLEFCYKRLPQEIYYPAIRFQAALLLGSFTSIQMSGILAYFTTKFGPIGKKDTEVRAFVPYQRAMQHFDFGVADEQRANETLSYLKMLIDKIPNIKKARKALFPEICATIKAIFSETLKLDNEKKLKEWQAFCKSNPQNETKFWDLFKGVYNALLKLVKTHAKHKMWVMDAHQCMLARAPEEFYFSKNPNYVDELLKLVASSMKDKKEKNDAFLYSKCFVRDIKADYVKKDLDRFSNFVLQTIISNIFSKGSKFTPEECISTEQFLVEYAKKNIHGCVKVIEKLLEGTYSTEQKAVSLRALAKIGTIYYDDILNYNYLLGPLVSNFILEEKKRNDVILLRAALLCIPRVKNPSEEKMKEIRYLIGQSIIHPDEETSLNSSKALQNSVELEPGKTFLEVLQLYVMSLLKISEVEQDVVRLLTDLTTSLDIFIMQQYKDPKINIDAPNFLNLRKRIEGVAIVYLCHTEAEVRSKAITLLKTVSREELRSITRGKVAQDVHLVDGILNIPQTDKALKSSTWYTPLEEMCILKAEDYDSIQFALGELLKYWCWSIDDLKNDAQCQLLGNYAKFCALALRPSTGEGATIFLADLLTLLHGPLLTKHQLLHEVILDALSCVHPSCFELVLGQIRHNGISRTELKEKKGKRVETTDAVYERNVLEVLATFMRKLSSDLMFGKLIAIRDFIEELIGNWVLKEKIEARDLPGSLLTIETWKYAADIIAKYLQNMHQATCAAAVATNSEVSDAVVTMSPLINKNSLQRFRERIFDFVHPSEPLSSIDEKSISVVTGLCSFGQIKEEFVPKALNYYHIVLIQTPHLADLIVDSMATLLRNNPQSLKVFIAHSHAEIVAKEEKGNDFEGIGSGEDTPTKKKRITKVPSMTKKTKEEMMEKEHQHEEFNRAVPLITGCYLRAIVKVLEENLESWIEKQVTSVGALTFIALYHAASENMILRNAAVELLYILCNLPQSNYTPGQTLYFSTTEEPATIIKTVERYSQYIAPMNPKATVELFAEMDRTIDVVSDDNKLKIFTIAVPWANNYGKVLAEAVVEGEGAEKYKIKGEAAPSIFKNIFSITKRLHDNNLSFKRFMEDIWRELMKSRSYCPVVVDEVVQHIIEDYSMRTGFELSTPSLTKKKHTLLKAIVSYCSRDTSSLPYIVAKLVQHLRDYREEIKVEDKLGFTLWHLDRGVLSDSNQSSFIQANERSAVEILVDLAYEHDVALVPHLPIIFVNCVILFNSTQAAPVTEATLLLENLYQSLSMRFRSKNESLKETTQFKKLQFRNTANHYRTPIPKYSREFDFVATYVKTLSQHHKTFAAEVSKIVLRWAIQAIDKKICLESYYIFLQLNEFWDHALLELLALSFFESCRVRNDAKLSVIMEILLKVPLDLFAQPKSLKLGFQLAFFLLYTPNKELFLLGLRLILKLQSIAATGKLDTAVINTTAFNVWKGYTGTETVDVTIARLLFKGLTDKATFEDTLDFYSNMVSSFSPTFMEDSNMLVATVLVIHAVLIAAGNERFKPKLQTFLNSVCSEAVRKPFIACFEKHIAASEQEKNHRPFDEKQLALFTDDFAENYSAVFGNKSGNYTVWLFSCMLKYASRKWKNCSLLLLSKLIPSSYQVSWTSRELCDLSKLLRESMVEDNELLYKAADKGLEYLLRTIRPAEEKFRKEMFDFMKPIEGYEKAIRAKHVEDKGLFVGSVNIEREAARSEIMRRVWTQIFDLSVDHETNQLHFDAFGKMLSWSAALAMQEPKHQRTTSSSSSPRITPRTPMEGAELTPTAEGKDEKNTSFSFPLTSTTVTPSPKTSPRKVETPVQQPVPLKVEVPSAPVERVIEIPPPPRVELLPPVPKVEEQPPQPQQPVITTPSPPKVETPPPVVVAPPEPVKVVTPPPVVAPPKVEEPPKPTPLPTPPVTPPVSMPAPPVSSVVPPPPPPPPPVYVAPAATVQSKIKVVAKPAEGIAALTKRFGGVSGAPAPPPPPPVYAPKAPIKIEKRLHQIETA